MNSDPDDTPAGRLRAIAERDDLWQLQQDDGESDDDFALRSLSLFCDADGRRRIKRRWLAGDAV